MTETTLLLCRHKTDGWKDPWGIGHPAYQVREHLNIVPTEYTVPRDYGYGVTDDQIYECPAYSHIGGSKVFARYFQKRLDVNGLGCSWNEVSRDKHDMFSRVSPDEGWSWREYSKGVRYVWALTGVRMFTVEDEV